MTRLTREEWAEVNYPETWSAARKDFPNGAKCFCQRCRESDVSEDYKRIISLDVIDCAISLQHGWPRCGKDHGTLTVRPIPYPPSL